MSLLLTMRTSQYRSDTAHRTPRASDTANQAALLEPDNLGYPEAAKSFHVR